MKTPKGRRLLLWTIAVGAICYFAGCDAGSLLSPEPANEQMQSLSWLSDAGILFSFHDPESYCGEVASMDCWPMWDDRQDQVASALSMFVTQQCSYKQTAETVIIDQDRGYHYAVGTSEEPRRAQSLVNESTGYIISIALRDDQFGNTRKLAQAVIHEAIHASNPQMLEWQVLTIQSQCIE